jgi:glycosyltransferase involved in cell wall biosynthesis
LARSQPPTVDGCLQALSRLGSTHFIDVVRRFVPMTIQQKLVVAILDEELPYPPDSGKRIRSFNLVRRLAEYHRIIYLSHQSRTSEETRVAETYLRDHRIEVVVVERPVPLNSGPGFYARVAANLLSPLPYSVQRHWTEDMRTAVRRLNAERTVDLWQVEWTPYAQNLRRAVDAPWVVVAHNIESQIWRRYHETESNPLKRWYIGRQHRKYLKFEQEIFSEADRVIVVSDPDADLARQLYGTTKLEVVSNGVDVDYFQPSGEPRDPKTILFLGALYWRPNLDAVQVLLREVFPRVLADEPDARLQIVGRDPPAWLFREVSACPNVSLHPSVPDVRPFLRRCGMLAVPMRVGGGSRLKILEALACGCPVVSTRVGSEGLDLTPGRDYAEADALSAMASTILQFIREPNWAAELATSGRARVLDKYSWDPLAERLGMIWEAQATGAVASRPGHVVGMKA